MLGCSLPPYTLVNSNQSSTPLLPRQVQSRNITSGMQTAIHCQNLSSFSIYASQLFHYPLQTTCTVAYYAYSPRIDAIDQISSIQFRSTQLFNSSDVLRCYLPFHLGVEVWSSCEMPRYLYPSSSTFLTCWSSGRSIPLLPTCLPLLNSRKAHLSSPNDVLRESPYHLNK